MHNTTLMRSITTILAATALLLTANIQAGELGKIIEISTEKESYKRGEVIEVIVKVQSFQKGRNKHLIALNFINSKDKTVYDSHEENEDKDFLIKKDQIKTIGPFMIKTKGLKKGRYNLLAGYRADPWEPLIEFQGVKWCPPVKNIEIK